MVGLMSRSAARAFVSQYFVTTGSVIDFTTVLVNGVLTSGKRPMAQSSNEWLLLNLARGGSRVLSEKQPPEPLRPV